MKKLAFSFALLLLISIHSLASSGSAGKGVTWNLKDGILTIAGEGPMKDFSKDRPWIPSKVIELHVEEGITYIGANLCRGANRLKSIDLPSSLKKIGHDAFNGCLILPEIHIPYGVEQIEEKAFYDCKGIIELDMPITLKSIGHQAFARCSNLSAVRMSQGVESIGENAFQECNSLISLQDLPNFVTSENNSDYGFSKLAFNKFKEKKEAISALYGASSENGVSPNDCGVSLPPSDVDEDIPYTGLEKKNTFALIIANENYAKLSNVPYAHNDGDVFSLYCRQTLGVPKKNVLMYKDASYGSLREAMSDLRQISQVVGDDMRLIVYYAGHGAPEDASAESYLIPVDAGKVTKDACLSLADFYKELGALRLKSAMVFMDACFSGATREDKMIMPDSRSIVRVPKKEGLTGKVVVFSATSDDQTAMPYHEKGHGMFTYFLLKHLKDTKGSSTLADFKEYIVKEVALNSALINRKVQTPTYTVSPEVSSVWDSWKFTD